jgi:hypothetical protein
LQAENILLNGIDFPGKNKMSASSMSILTILSNHQARYPLMEAQDAYKLLYQVAFGSAHAVINPQDAYDWLQREVESLIEPYPEPAIDPISPDGALVRVHLSPYLAQSGDLTTLVDAFVRTSQVYHQDREKFGGYLEQAMPNVQGLADLVNRLKDQGYPAAHHSPIYREAYKPAYRIVLKRFL